MMKLKDKVAIVTGAGGGGLGTATSVLFAEEGAEIVAVDVDIAGGEELIKRIKKSGGEAIVGGEAIFIKADVSKPANAERMVKEAVEKYGRIDILVNNAAIQPMPGDKDNVIDASIEYLNKVVDVNLKGPFFCSKYAVPYMIKQDNGVIVNVASIGAIFPYPNTCIYGATKAGVMGLTRAMAVDLGKYKIRVNALCPSVYSPHMKRYIVASPEPEKMEQALLRSTPWGVPKPEEMAKHVLYLASEETYNVTGTILIAHPWGISFQ